VIAVIGGATGMIGDPSGKSHERSFLSVEELKKNQAGITQVLSRFLKNNPAHDRQTHILNNYDWFKDFSFIHFLRDVGKNFTVNHMLAKDSVKGRLEDREHGISYTEFSYMLLQAYDFYHLNQHYRCRLQIGGSDQWGNITAGTDLIRRLTAAHNHDHSSEAETELHPHTCFGLTSPLVTKSDGSKFGKSESGNVWLTADKTSPYQLYQFFIQTEDGSVIQYLKYFTFLSHEEIAVLERSLQERPEAREAQKRLAQEIVRMVHGEEALQTAEQSAQALFQQDFTQLSLEQIKQSMEGTPQSELPLSSLQPGLSLLDLLVQTGLCASRGAAKKDIQGGGISLNQNKISDPMLMITAQELLHSSLIILRKGKKNYHLVYFT
jgi:tyrosyl-tRNA synthetase